MVRYSRRPTTPYASMDLGDYLWWAFLVVFRLWFICQVVTGAFTAIYWSLTPAARTFMFADYIALWNKYERDFVPEWVDWMPMWYERSVWPVISILLLLRALEFLRRFVWFRRLFPWAFREVTRPPPPGSAFRWRAGQTRSQPADDGFEYDPGQFHARGSGKDQPREESAPERPLAIEDELEVRMRQYDREQPAKRDAKAEKAEKMMRDPRTPRTVREAALRLLERRRGRK